MNTRSVARVTLLAVTAALGAGCADSVTRTDYLETDTWISSADPSSHAELPVLNVSKSANVEERALLKFPTGARDPDQSLDQLLKGPLALALWPFYFHIEIIESLLNCQGKGLSSSNLSSARLVFDVDASGAVAASGAMQLEVLSKPWFQTANWERAHGFSSKGRWDRAGGDVDAAYSTVVNTVSSGAVEFDVTSHFRSWITSGEAVHYGMVLRSAGGGALATTTLKSVQTGVSTERPRLVSTYNCISTMGTGFVAQQDHWQTTTTYLGAPVR